MIGHAPKIKMMKEHGRHLRLDDEGERKLITGAFSCNWRAPELVNLSGISSS